MLKQGERRDIAKAIALSTAEAQRRARVAAISSTIATGGVEAAIAAKADAADLTALDTRVGDAETAITALDGRLDAEEAATTAADGRLDALEAADTALDARLDPIELALPNKLEWTAAPAAAGDPGTAGQIAYEAGFLYVCVATDAWERVAIATWP